jgi:hypothetical protein
VEQRAARQQRSSSGGGKQTQKEPQTSDSDTATMPERREKEQTPSIKCPCAGNDSKLMKSQRDENRKEKVGDISCEKAQSLKGRKKSL